MKVRETCYGYQLGMWVALRETYTFESHIFLPGFILQKMEGDGMAFMHAGGTIIKRELRNEKIRLDTGCLVAYTTGINFDVQFSPGLKTALFGRFQ